MFDDQQSEEQNNNDIELDTTGDSSSSNEESLPTEEPVTAEVEEETPVTVQPVQFASFDEE